MACLEHTFFFTASLFFRQTSNLLSFPEEAAALESDSLGGVSGHAHLKLQASNFPYNNKLRPLLLFRKKLYMSMAFLETMAWFHHGEYQLTRSHGKSRAWHSSDNAFYSGGSELTSHWTS